MILQLLNWRLMRHSLHICTPQKIFVEIVQVFFESATPPIVESTPVLFEQFQTLFMKICLQLTDVPILPAESNPILSESCIRALIYGLARLLKVKGLRDLGGLKEMKRLVGKTMEHTKWRPPPTALAAFPESLRAVISELPTEGVRLRRKTLDEVVGDAQTRLFGPTTAIGQRDHQRELAERLKVEVELQVQFPLLCWAAIHGVVTKKISRSLTADTALNHIQFAEVIKIIPPKQLVKATFSLMEYLIREDSVVDPFPDAVSRLVWQYGLLRIDNVLIALSDHLPADKAVLLLNHLLFKDPHFRSACQGWCTALETTGTQHWIHDDVTPITDFVTAKSYVPVPRRDAYGADPPIVTYFPWEIDCVLPVVELLIGRFVEEGMAQSVASLVAEYGQMFSFHATPVGSVHSMLFYYYSLSDASMRVSLAGVCFKIPFEPMLVLKSCRDFLEQPCNEDGTINTQPLNSSFILDALQIIQQVSTVQHIPDNGPWSIFEESGGNKSIRSVVTAFSLQLMTCGMSAYWQPESDQFNYPREIAALIAMLPAEFDRIFTESVAMFLPINVKWTCNLAAAWLWSTLPEILFSALVLILEQISLRLVFLKRAWLMAPFLFILLPFCLRAASLSKKFAK